MAAALALHVLGAAHPADRPVLAAVRALRDQFEPAEAVDADEPPRQLRGTQPGLSATRALRAPQGALGRLLPLGPPSQAGIYAFGHATRVPAAYRARDGAEWPRRKSAALIGLPPGG